MHTYERRIVAAVITLLLFHGTLIAQNRVKFTKKPLPEGTIVHIAMQSVTKAITKISVAEQIIDQSQNSAEKEVRVITAIKVVDGKTVKAKISYPTFESSMEKTGSDPKPKKTETSPIAGKTYLLEIKNSKLIAKRENGEDLSAPELKVLKDKYESGTKLTTLFSPYQKMDDMLEGREFTFGEEVRIKDGLGKALFGAADEEEISFENVTLILKKTKKVFGVQCAIFEIKINPKMGNLFKDMDIRGLKMKATLKGELTVGIKNLWCYRLKISGPLTMVGFLETPNGKVGLDSLTNMNMSGMATFRSAQEK